MSYVAGIDLSTKALDLVLIDEDGNQPRAYTYELGAGDIVDRIRTIGTIWPSRYSSIWDDVLAIGIELIVVQVTMGVHQDRFRQAHFRRAPTGMSSWKPARTGLPPSTDAATIMPLDSMPFSLRGCKFATMTTLRWGSCSGV